METARKRIFKAVSKINDRNDKIIRNRLNNIVDLKFGKIRKDVKKGNHYHHEILLNEDSFKFSQTTKHLLDIVNEYMDRYSFLRLYIKEADDKTSNSLCVDISWDDYLNLLNGIDLEPRGDLATTIREMNKKNTKVFELSLKTQIAKAKNSSQFSKSQTSQKIFLAKGTMHHPVTRIHFQKLINSFQKRFPFVQIRYIKSNIAYLRVFWDNYYEQPTQGGEHIENGKIVMGTEIRLERDPTYMESARQYYPQQPQKTQMQYSPPSYPAPTPEYREYQSPIQTYREPTTEYREYRPPAQTYQPPQTYQVTQAPKPAYNPSYTYDSSLYQEDVPPSYQSSQSNKSIYPKLDADYSAKSAKSVKSSKSSRPKIIPALKTRKARTLLNKKKQSEECAPLIQFPETPTHPINPEIHSDIFNDQQPLISL